MPNKECMGKLRFFVEFALASFVKVHGTMVIRAPNKSWHIPGVVATDI
jgi:hypothetical protein